METVVIHREVNFPYVAIIISPKKIERILLGGDNEKTRGESLNILRKINPYLDHISIVLECKKDREKKLEKVLRRL